MALPTRWHHGGIRLELRFVKGGRRPKGTVVFLLSDHNRRPFKSRVRRRIADWLCASRLVLRAPDIEFQENVVDLGHYGKKLATACLHLAGSEMLGARLAGPETRQATEDHGRPGTCRH